MLILSINVKSDPCLLYPNYIFFCRLVKAWVVLTQVMLSFEGHFINSLNELAIFKKACRCLV